MYTQLVQPLERSPRGIISNHTLRQLQFEQRGCKAVLVERPTHQLRKFRVLQLLGRDIQGEPRRRNVLIAPARQLRTGSVEYPTADVDDQPTLFSRRHE